MEALTGARWTRTAGSDWGEHEKFLPCYLLEVSLVNVALGLYLQPRGEGWRRILQWAGSLLISSSPVFMTMAFVTEPALGLAGRGWRSYFGMIGLFAGVMAHAVSNAGAPLRRGVN